MNERRKDGLIDLQCSTHIASLSPPTFEAISTNLLVRSPRRSLLALGKVVYWSTLLDLTLPRASIYSDGTLVMVKKVGRGQVILPARE